MKVERLELQGYKGAVDNTFFRQGSDTDHLAILFPGRGYTTQGPVLYYPGALLRSQGADVLNVDYAYNKLDEFNELPDEEQAAWLKADGKAALDAALSQRNYQQLTLVGKSLGTLVLALLLPDDERLADASVVWLTPVFRYPLFLKQLEACKQRSLFVIGTADPHHDSNFLEGRNAYVIDGADHSLEMAGDTFASLKVLSGMLKHIQAFLRE